jgi:glucosamine 6-phosphate synthetase-like amidotransferase/phosphosugar isomerase protein
MCGIFGFAKTSGRQSDNQLEILKRVVTELTDESSIRGTDSTGFSIINEDNRYTYKTLTDSSTLVGFPEWNTLLDKVNRDTTIFMGHVRLATTGSVRVENAHPIIHNYNQVSNILGKSVPDVDSQVLFQALNKLEMSKAFEDIDGDFAITWVKDSNKKVHLARESGRPMVVAYWKKARVLLWASTRQIMEDAMTRAGLRLPITNVKQDYIFTYDTDKLYSGTQYYRGNGYSMSPATKSLHSISTCDTDRNELCYFCFEYAPKEEINPNDGRPICVQCEVVENYRYGYSNEDERDNDVPF